MKKHVFKMAFLSIGLPLILAVITIFITTNLVRDAKIGNLQTQQTEIFTKQYGVDVISSKDSDNFVPLGQNQSQELLLKQGNSINDCLVALTSETSYLVNCTQGDETFVLNPINDISTNELTKMKENNEKFLNY